LARFFHPEGFAFGDDEDVVVKKAVEQADGR
jgi:hypothetical protein